MAHGKGKGGIMLLSNNLNQKTLSAFAVEFIIEDVFPRPQVQLAVCDGDHDLPAHDLPFHVAVGIVFIAVVAILAVGFFRSELFQPHLVIMMQAGFIIVDKDRCGNMHSVNEYKTLLDTAFSNQSLDLIMYRDYCPTLWNIHPDFFGQCFHVKNFNQNNKI